MKTRKNLIEKAKQKSTLASRAAMHLSQKAKKKSPENEIMSNEIMSKEETLATLLYAQHRTQTENSSHHHDENEVACAVKEWKEGKQAPIQRYDKSLLQEASKVLAAEQKMQANSQNYLPLPPILNYALKESLAKLQKKQKESSAPSIVVELLQDSIRVFKSTLHGFGNVLQPVTQSRGVQALKKPGSELLEKETLEEQSEDLNLKSNYALLRQKSKEEYLQYELLRDSKHSITLLISAPECLRKSKAVLRNGERTIAAESFHVQSGFLKFKNLKVGEYDLEFCGAIEYNVRLLIRPRLGLTK